jgi:hypothetical protein
MAEHLARRLEYIACHDAGMSVAEAAQHIGCALSAVHTFASRNGRTFRDVRIPTKASEGETKAHKPKMTWAEMAKLERKRHHDQWNLGNAGATPAGQHALNENRMVQGEKARLKITAFLSKNPGVKRSAIAQGLGVNPNTLQSQLQRLHGTGVINRSARNEYTNAKGAEQ